MKSFINIIFLLLPFNILSSILKFKFTMYPYPSNIGFFDLLNSNLYTELKIGTPEQSIPVKISTNTTYLMIPGKSLNGQYDETHSSSYSKTNPTETYISSICYSRGFLSKDTITFEDYKGNPIKKENFPFFLPSIISSYYSKKNNDAYIGFNYKNKRHNEDFILYLHEENIINEQIFSFKFNNDLEGEIIIGDYPHIYNSKYDEENLYKIKVETGIKQENWVMKFDTITFGNKKILYSTATIFFDSNVIFAPNNIDTDMESLFFENQKNKCEKKFDEDRNLTYYSCDKSVNINKFPSLKFYMRDFNETFEIKGKDLWTEINNRLYCLIVIPENFYGWELGIPFLKTHEFIFEVDRGYIGIYKGISFSFPWFLVFLFIIIIIALVYILFTKNKNIIKRKKANELLETLDTSSIEK